MSIIALSELSCPHAPGRESGTGVDEGHRQFDSNAPAQKWINFHMIATRNYAEYEKRNRTRNTLYMLKTQKPLSWFLLAFLAEQGRRYSTDFDGERYWFLTSQPCCRGHRRTDVFVA